MENLLNKNSVLDNDLENEEVSKLDRIDTNKVNIIINEDEFVIPYGIKYKMVVKQPDDALSKMYDEKNEMIVNLRIPTSEYGDEDLQELIKWSTLSNLDEGYFRNLAIYMRINEKFERTVVFTHAYIRMNKKVNTKADYVDIELIVNQRGDKFVGVGFGHSLEDTLKKTKDRATNPPRINVVVPVVVSDDNETIEGIMFFQPRKVEKYILRKISSGLEVEHIDIEYEENDDLTDHIREIIENGYVHNRNYEEVDIIDEGGIFRRKIEETKYIAEYTRNIVTINLTATSSNDIKVDGYEAENDKVFIIDPLNFSRILGYKVYDYKQTTDEFVITLVDGEDRIIDKHIITDLFTGKSFVVEYYDALEFYNTLKDDFLGIYYDFRNSRNVIAMSQISLVTRNQLQRIYKNTTVEVSMIQELNKILYKYKITNIENIQHFIAQTCKETLYGMWIKENGTEEYFNSLGYTTKYSGVGYIHMTHKYGYQAFATYLILESNETLKNKYSYKNPKSSDADMIQKTYNNILLEAENLGIVLGKYTRIVDIGRDYVADNFAWETAGYFWSVNGLTYANANTPVDDVTKIVNIWDSEQGYEDRVKAYDIVVTIIY